MIVTTELINGLARKLHSIRAYPVYVDEIKNNVQFPCWRIKLLDDASVKLVVGDRYQQDTTFDVWMILNERGEIGDVRGQVIALAESLCMTWKSLPWKMGQRYEEATCTIASPMGCCTYS